VAQTSTIYVFDIDLADADRQHYDTLSLRVPRHPSESEDYLVARVLAYCLEHTEGIEFSNGLSDPDQPTISIRDPTGSIRTWIDIGAPDAARLHKASKAAQRVAVYTHRDPTQWLRQLSGERIHRAAEIEISSFTRALVDGLTAQLARRLAMTVSIADRHVLVALDGMVLEGDVIQHHL
jgi:uncharacterized protein YaeQ